MNTRGLLDQLLKSGSDLINKGSAAGSAPAQSGRAGASPLGGLLAGAGGGAAVSMLLGSKKARKLGGKAVVYGGAAALGLVAWKAWQNYQRGQSATSAAAEPRTIDRLPAQEAEQHSQAILRALIAAAKADGHIDQRERELIDAEIARISSEPTLLQWFDRELQKPLDPAEVAAAADSPELAAEMYLASLLMIDQQSFMEKAYLDELARQLELPAALRAELDAQAFSTG